MIRVRSLSELTYPKPSLKVASSIPIVHKEQHPAEAEREDVNDERTEKVRKPKSGQAEETQGPEYGRGRPKKTTIMRLEDLIKKVIAEEEEEGEQGQGEGKPKRRAISRLEEFIAKLVAEKSLGAQTGKSKKGKLMLRFDELIRLLTTEPEVVTPIKRDKLLRKNYRPKLSRAAVKLVGDVTAACIQEYRVRNKPQRHAPPDDVIAQQELFTSRNGQHTNKLATNIVKAPPTFYIPTQTLQKKTPYHIDKTAKIRVQNRLYEMSKKRQYERVDTEKQIQHHKRNADRTSRDYRAKRRNARRTRPQGMELEETLDNEQPTDTNSIDEAEEERTISTDDETLENRLKQFQRNKKRKIDKNSSKHPTETVLAKQEKKNELKIDQPITQPVINNNLMVCLRTDH